MSAREVEAIARHALLAANTDLNALTGDPYDTPLDADPAGPLAGVPFLIKDSEPFARGTSFTLGSRSVRGARASVDHPLMARFRAAGLSTLGQTTTPEWSLNFATESLRHGITRNPWASDRDAGGSSGGAAALVAAGAVPIAHASDGAGSIRVPAACCGLVGLKPGRGTVPVSADPTLASSGTVVGEPLGVDFALTRTVRDATAMLRLLRGEPAGDSFATPRPLRRRLRLAVATTAWSAVPVNGQVAAASSAVAEMLEWIGHTVDAATPSLTADDIAHGAMLGMLSAGRAVLAAPVQPSRNLLEGVSRAVLREAASLEARDLERYLAAQRTVTRSVDSFFERFDVLITPTLAQLPAPHGTLAYNTDGITVREWLDRMLAFGPFTAPFNISGHPAISLPLAQSVEGLPIGVQLVSAHGGEELLLSLAAELEQAMPWSDRRPPLSVG